MDTPDTPDPLSADPAGAPGNQPKGDDKPDAPPHPGVAAPDPGMAPPRGELLEPEIAASRIDPPAVQPPPPPDRALKEGEVYRTPDGEERLVWVIRNGVAEYFARRDGGRWTGTVVDRGLLSTEAFAREVGLG